MSDMNNLLREMIFDAYREEKMRRNELRQIIHKACSQPHRRNRFYCRFLIWIGDHLVTWGNGLLTRFNIREMIFDSDREEKIIGIDLRQTIHETCSQSHRRNRFHCRFLIWFGDHLVIWGNGLITRFDVRVDGEIPGMVH